MKVQNFPTKGKLAVMYKRLEGRNEDCLYALDYSPPNVLLDTTEEYTSNVNVNSKYLSGVSLEFTLLFFLWQHLVLCQSNIGQT